MYVSVSSFFFIYFFFILIVTFLYIFPFSFSLIWQLLMIILFARRMVEWNKKRVSGDIVMCDVNKKYVVFAIIVQYSSDAELIFSTLTCLAAFALTSTEKKNLYSFYSNSVKNRLYFNFIMFVVHFIWVE